MMWLVTGEHRRTWLVIGAAAALSALLRMRMLWSAVSVDEGGYLAAARAWAHGHVLYRDIFIDRPQGLLVLFRFWDWISGGNTASIRILAMLFGALLVVATGIIVRETVGDRAARYAAVLCAIVSAAPVLEGYAANAELLSGAVAAAGLALGVLALSKKRPLPWFFASGLVAGLALSLKQSAFDGLLTLATWLIAVAVVSVADRRRALRALAVAGAGVISVIVLLVVHGALTGWSRWWTAVVGYRLRTQSLFASAEWSNMVRVAPYAIVVLGASVVPVVIGTRWAIRDLRRTGGPTLTAAPLMLVLWLGWASTSFFVGGGFWRHYWMLLMGPLSALAGVGISRLPRLGPLAAAIVVVPCLAVTSWVYAADRTQLNIRAAADHRAMVDEHVAAWFNSHREPGESLYALCGSAAVYADAHQDPEYPFLWQLETLLGANAQNRLVAYLSDPRTAPHYVAEYQSPKWCDRSGRVGRIMNQWYHKVAVVGSVTIFKRAVP